MTYVIQRRPQKDYVAKPGSTASYTREVRNMQTFTTREEANKNRCPGNEVVITLDL